MAKEQTKPNEPVEPVQRRPSDIIWFILLFLSIATGLCMTIFAPI